MGEERTPLGTVMFRGVEYDRLSHFYPEADWRRCRDFWGKEGWVVGHRDRKDSHYKARSGAVDGHGGQVYVLDDKGRVHGLHPNMVTIIE